MFTMAPEMEYLGVKDPACPISLDFSRGDELDLAAFDRAMQRHGLRDGWDRWAMGFVVIDNVAHLFHPQYCRPAPYYTVLSYLARRGVWGPVQSCGRVIVCPGLRRERVWMEDTSYLRGFRGIKETSAEFMEKYVRLQLERFFEITTSPASL